MPALEQDTLPTNIIANDTARSRLIPTSRVRARDCASHATSEETRWWERDRGLRDPISADSSTAGRALLNYSCRTNCNTGVASADFADVANLVTDAFPL